MEMSGNISAAYWPKKRKMLDQVQHETKSELLVA
jgi:hypothetical protein